jgi:hypothetical protein
MYLGFDGLDSSFQFHLATFLLLSEMMRQLCDFGLSFPGLGEISSVELPFVIYASQEMFTLLACREKAALEA